MNHHDDPQDHLAPQSEGGDGAEATQETGEPGAEQAGEQPVAQTREDDAGFQPVSPPGIDPGQPAIPDPVDGQNPPPRRL